jgi:hypothetical protein
VEQRHDWDAIGRRCVTLVSASCLCRRNAQASAAASIESIRACPAFAHHCVRSGGLRLVGEKKST